MNQNKPPLPPIPPKPLHTTVPPKSPQSNGFISEEAKKKYTTYTVILMVIFFMAQFIIPMVGTYASMPNMFMPEAMFSGVAVFGKSAVWNDRVIYVERALNRKDSEGNIPVIKALTLTKKSQSEELGPSPIEYPWLLADGSRLWITSHFGVGYYEYGRFQTLFRPDNTHDISPPFMYKGLPAALVDFDDHAALAVVDGDGWRKEFEFYLDTDEMIYFEDQMRIVPIGDELHIFLEYKGRLYYKLGLPRVIDEKLTGWTLVDESVEGWTAVAIDGFPVLFYEEQDGMKRYLNGSRIEGDDWSPIFRQNLPVTGNFGVMPLGEQGRFLIASQTLPGSSRIWLAEGDNILAEYRTGGSFPMPMDYMKNMTIIQLVCMFFPFIMVIIMARLMSSYRIVVYDHPAGRFHYASLVKRGFAQLIDGLFVFGPVMVVGYFYFFDMFDFEKIFSEGPGVLVPIFTFWGIAMLWFLGWVVVLSISEGRWGTTPGKWLLGIRVLGVELAPCGIGRAFLRNLLRIADGFFSYLVGIVLVAFTEKWQRVGDMAAKTIVVDIRKPIGSPQSAETDFEFE